MEAEGTTRRDMLPFLRSVRTEPDGQPRSDAMNGLCRQIVKPGLEEGSGGTYGSTTVLVV